MVLDSVVESNVMLCDDCSRLTAGPNTSVQSDTHL